MFKKHFKNSYFGTFTGNKGKTNTILKDYYLGQVGVINWAKFAASKIDQLGPDNNP